MNKEYTTKENLWYYTKRFLKTFVPAAIVVLAIPELGLSSEGFLVSVAVPFLTTLEKWMRNNNWYKL